MRALILVDMQNDFMPDGALPVPDGDSIVPLVNALQEKFTTIIATKDWHPAHHGSFASQHPGKNPGDVIDLNGLPQILWPDHCIQETSGSEFHPTLNTDKLNTIIYKGTDPEIDSYSGFYDNGHRKATGLDTWLKEHNVDTIYVCGLATDYCVKFTALDGCRAGYATYVITDACRAVNLSPDDEHKALEEMKQAGCQLIQSDVLLAESTR
ncbi:MAG: bifunctional nicotinamidase/pyrazinamidase [Calditrichaeota bacterium]|nr:MAG: bifunctional nicotinamidase/pyrazinamidase [Calditrichota bacterium]